MNLPRRTRKRLPKTPRVPLIAPNEPNTMWALDFMYDTLYYGRPFRALNVIDESNREVLAIEIDLKLPAARVVRTLEQLEEIHCLPKAIRLDNGSELRSAIFMGGCEKKGNLAGTRVIKFKFHNQQMLLAYSVSLDKTKLVLMGYGVHENFYRDLKR